MEKILLFEDNVKVKATKTSNLVGSDAFTLTATNPGTAGNSITMLLTDSDGLAAPTASVTGNVVTVLADLDTANATVTKIVAAINNTAAVAAKVLASGTGTATITAAITGSAFQLSGGTDEQRIAIPVKDVDGYESTNEEKIKILTENGAHVSLNINTGSFEKVVRNIASLYRSHENILTVCNDNTGDRILNVNSVADITYKP